MGDIEVTLKRTARAQRTATAIAYLETALNELVFDAMSDVTGFRSQFLPGAHQ